MKKIPIGRDDFKTLIEENYYYVDKTKMIEEILEKGAYVTLFPRPRRFGKSLMISTIEEFFNVETKQENKNLFKGLYISKSKYIKEQGKYPIIKLNLKSIEAENWEEMYNNIKEEFRQIFESKRYVIDILSDTEKIIYTRFLTKEADIAEYRQALKILSQYLYKYYGEKVILLIDEYDVPIQSGYLRGYYNEIVEFIKNLLGNGLKSNTNIKLAIMTGVLRVSKESIFSDLNNVKVYSVIDKTYNEYFGFTEQETKEILKHYKLQLTPEIKQMYNGYIFGEQEIYNPWSIINYIEDKRLLPYWVNTSGNELVKDIFNQTREETQEMLEELILGKTIECKYNEKVTFLDLNAINQREARDIVLNFLLISGYLTKEKGTDISANGTLLLKIPNSEVRTVYVDIMAKWLLDTNNLNTQNLADLSEALLEGKPEVLERMLNELLNHMSYTETQESFYHGYMLGLCIQFLNREYIVKSNREAGNGRFDVMIESVNRKIGIILEFKIAKDNEDLYKKLEEGKSQIIEKAYYKELELDRVKNILTYAIVFKGKECRVK